MTTVVVTSTYISVDSRRYESLNFEAYCDGNKVGIRNIHNKDLRIIEKQDYSNILLNGVVELSANAFVVTFNALITYYRLGEILDSNEKLDTIIANSNYPNHPFSRRVTADVETQIFPNVVPGYMTIKAHGDNTGNVYIGAEGLGAGSGELAPGESVAFELDNLGLLYALNASAGDDIDVFGAYHA